MYGHNWKVPDPNFDIVVSSCCAVPDLIGALRCIEYARFYDRLWKNNIGKTLGYYGQLTELQEDPCLIEHQSSLDINPDSYLD